MPTKKSWTDAVHKIVLGLPREFATVDVYEYERQLKRAHPQNRNIRAKIRQQLQVLRDRGTLSQPERGCWKRK